MAIAIACGEVAMQISLLALTYLGWGYVLAALRWLPRPKGRFSWIIRLVGGLSAFTLFLLALTYADIPLRYSAWLALVIGVAGWVIRWQFPVRCQAARLFRDDYLAGALFLIIFLLQSIPVLTLGPGKYYGIGKIDQLNYIVLGQFLIEHSLNYPAPPGQIEPWQQLTVPTREERLGAYMSLGYPAALFQCDTQRLFATGENLFLALLAPCTFMCLRRFSVSTPLALAGAFWLGIAHAVTLNSHVAFFSNLSVLFVAPLLVGVLWRYRQRPESLRLLPALLLAYTLCSYSEFFPFISLVIVLQFLLLAAGRKLKFMRLAIITLILVLAFSSPYLPRLSDFLHRQLGNATKTALYVDPNLGQWRGWAELFFADIKSRHFPWVNDATTLLAMGAVAVALFGLFSSRQLRKRYLLLLAVGTTCWPLLLLVVQPFRDYVFYKLCFTFLPLFIILIMVGFQQLWHVSRRRNWWLRPGIGIYLTLLISGSLLSSFIAWRTVIQMQGQIPCNTPAAFATYGYVREHPQEIYYVSSSDRYLACWIAYHARRSKVYTQQEVIYPHWLTSEENLHPAPPPPYTLLNGEHPPLRIMRSF